MKKAIICLLLLHGAVAQAQVLKKIKDQARNAVVNETRGEAGRSNNAQQPSATGGTTTGTTRVPGYTYLDNRQAIDKFGTKIHTLPQGYSLLRISGGVQYWVENGTLKYYLTTGVITETEGHFEDKKVFFSDGSSKPGDPASLNLPLSRTGPANPPCIVGYGTYDDDVSEKNYVPLTDEHKELFSITVATSNHLPVYTLMVNKKKIGDYKAAINGAYSYKTGKYFFLSSSNNVMTNALYADGKIVKEFDQPVIPSGLIFCSADGTKAAFAIMQPDKMDPEGKMPYLFSDGHILPPFTGFQQAKLLNSGEMARILEPQDNGYDSEHRTYMMNGAMALKMPGAHGVEFFSNQTATKWASHTDNAVFFSDHTAIADEAQAQKLQGRLIAAPKKVDINGKSHLVWLQQAGNDIYLCKKEL